MVIWKHKENKKKISIFQKKPLTKGGNKWYSIKALQRAEVKAEKKSKGIEKKVLTTR